MKSPNSPCLRGARCHVGKTLSAAPGRNSIGRARTEDDPLLIQGYLGYGTRERLYLLARVLEDRGVAPSSEEASALTNFKGAWKRFRSREVPHAHLIAELGDLRQEYQTDDEGYLRAWLELPEGLERFGIDTDEDELANVTLNLLEPRPEDAPPTVASVLIPSPEAEFGVISDIDDTVLQTGATSMTSIARQVFLGNAHSRLPFSGVPAFYEALAHDLNPLFYVSSSPWNLYDVLVEFMELNDIPLGPLLLRDWDFSPKEVLSMSHGAHKQEAIRQILDTFPKMPFILVGDCGQEDPEIYHQVVHDYPTRILGVYIRDVSNTGDRRESVKTLAREVENAGSILKLVPDTAEAAEHASAQGWVPEDAVARVRAHQAKERASE